MYLINEAIDNYATEYSQVPSELLQQLIAETKEKTGRSIMLSSPISGSFLKMLVLISQPRLVVELGAFTGLSALYMAEALPADCRIITCEVNQDYATIAKKYFKQSPFGSKIELKEQAALEMLDSIEEPVDLFFIDADKINYLKYYEKAMDLLRPGGLIVVDNCLWFGDVLDPKDEDAETIHALNQRIQKDDRVDHVILTVKDGLHLVRKK
jgi:Predicted O-methyltransferase